MDECSGLNGCPEESDYWPCLGCLAKGFGEAMKREREACAEIAREHPEGYDAAEAMLARGRS